MFSIIYLQFLLFLFFFLFLGFGNKKKNYVKENYVIFRVRQRDFEQKKTLILPTASNFHCNLTKRFANLTSFDEKSSIKLTLSNFSLISHQSIIKVLNLNHKKKKLKLVQHYFLVSFLLKLKQRTFFLFLFNKKKTEVKENL